MARWTGGQKKLVGFPRVMCNHSETQSAVDTLAENSVNGKTRMDDGKERERETSQMAPEKSTCVAVSSLWRLNLRFKIIVFLHLIFLSFHLAPIDHLALIFWIEFITKFSSLFITHFRSFLFKSKLVKSKTLIIRKSQKFDKIN